MSAPSNHTELSAFASELLSMLRDKPNDWKESVVLGGEDSNLDELSVLVFAIELLKSGYPIGLSGELVNGLEGFVSEGFSIKLATNAEELELTQLVIDKQIASMVEVKAGLERARQKAKTLDIDNRFIQRQSRSYLLSPLKCLSIRLTDSDLWYVRSFGRACKVGL